MIGLVLNNLWHQFYAWAFGFGGLAAVIGIGLIVLWYFTPVFLSSPAAKAMLLNIGLGCIAFAFVSGYYTGVGYRQCVAVVTMHDKAAIGRAQEGVRTVSECRSQGGTWDVITGECIK